MENLNLVYQETSNDQSPTHSRPTECGSRQTIQTRPDHSNRVVSPSRGLPSYMQQVAPASNRPTCHKVQQQVTGVTGSGSPNYSSGCTQSAMGGSGRVCLVCFDKDISPATISSWIKQTVILCYELSDQETHTLHQVKAHDVRAFAASKAFQSGVSFDQILSACHLKSHNTFTQFYLKDVAWADSELYHLGPVVAAQQIHK